MAHRGRPRTFDPDTALRQAPNDHQTARAAIHAMLRSTADQITRSDAPHCCMLILAAPTGAVENHATREFLAGIRRSEFAAIRDRLVRAAADGDLEMSEASVDAVARYYSTVVQWLSVQARDGATRAELEAVITCAMAGWDALTSAGASPCEDHQHEGARGMRPA